MTAQKFIFSFFFLGLLVGGGTLVLADPAFRDVVSVKVERDLRSSCGSSPIANSQFIAESGSITTAYDLSTLVREVDDIGLKIDRVSKVNATFQVQCAGVQSQGTYQSNGQAVGNAGVDLSQAQAEAKASQSNVMKDLSTVQQRLSQPPLKNNQYAPSCLGALRRATSLLKNGFIEYNSRGAQAAASCVSKHPTTIQSGK